MNENKDMENTCEATDAEEKVVSFKRDYAPHRRVSIRICKECGQTYTLPDGDAEYYFKKFGTLPLRCPKCREKRFLEDKEKEAVREDMHKW